MRPFAMLEQIDALPRTKRQCALVDRNRKLRVRQRAADVRGHVVRSFRRVPIQPRIFRHQTCEEAGEIRYNVRIGVFLNHQGC